MSKPLAMTARATLFLVSWGAAEALTSRAAAQMQPQAAAAREAPLQPPHEQRIVLALRADDARQPRRVTGGATERVGDGGTSAVQPASAVPGSVTLRLPLALGLLFGGLALTMLGAHLLIGSVLEIGDRFGISETVLGVTVVAVGTSLPELVTSVLAAWRRQPDIAFGNIVGSNIYNVFGILGVTAIVEPIPVPPELLSLDIWAMLGATILLLVFSLTGWRLSRGEGVVFLGAYAAWLVATV